MEDTYEALLSVPLINATRPSASSMFITANRHPHSDQEISAITFIGQQMSSAIAKSLLEDENARLAERSLRLQQYRAQLEEEVAQRTAQLKATNEELRRPRKRPRRWPA